MQENLAKIIQEKGKLYEKTKGELFRQRLTPQGDYLFDEEACNVSDWLPSDASAWLANKIILLIQRQTRDPGHFRCLDVVEEMLKHIYRVHGIDRLDGHSLVPKGSGPKVYTREPFVVLHRKGIPMVLQVARQIITTAHEHV